MILTVNFQDHSVKYDGAVGLPIYGLIVLFNCNICLASSPLLHKTLHNVRDLEFDLTLLKGMSDGADSWTLHIQFPIRA